MKICQSRKSTHSIMAHEGFGLLTIKKGNVVIHVPEEWLFNDGRIKKYALDKVNQMFAKAELFNNVNAGDVVNG